MNLFRGILKSPCLSVRPSVCQTVYKKLVSVKVTFSDGCSFSLQRKNKILLISNMNLHILKF